MRSLLRVSAVALSLIWLAGCEGNPGTQSGAPVAQPAPTTPDPAVPPSPPTAGSSSPTAAPSRVFVKLSSGVGFPQTAPDGTIMSFSVDYQFVEGEPGPSEYFLVIDRAAGPPATEVVRLERQGTLPVSLPGWKPEEGPFKAHLEDQNSNRVSEDIRMRRGG